MTTRPTTTRRRSRLGAAIALLGLVLVPAACGSDAADSRASNLEPVPVTAIPGPYDFDYTIPLGTATRLGRGEDVAVIPDALTAKVGQTIRIVNLDDFSHEVGTFYVLKGSTLTYRFTTAGVFKGTCTTHPSGEFTLTVLDA